VVWQWRRELENRPRPLENIGDGVLVIPHWRGTARVFSLLVNFQKPAVAPYAEGVSGAEGAFQEGAVADSVLLLD
jgi:hypothetical protein